MNENFMGPAQGMENQLQGILQDAVASQANQRANRSAKAQDMQDMAKLIDWHLSTAADFFKTDKLASYDVFQGGMRLMNREVPTFEQYDSASALINGAAEDYKNKDLGSMKFKLSQGDKLGIFRNYQDIARVSELQSQLQGAEAEKQAKAIADVQFPEHPQLPRAREHVAMIDMVGGDLSRVQPDELIRLTGRTDRAGQEEKLVHDRLIVEGQDEKQKLQKRMSQVFASDPAAYGKAAAITAASMTDPETMAKIYISDMIAKGENRTEDETRRMTAKIETWMSNTPIAAAIGLTSKQRESELNRAQLEDTSNRIKELDEHLAVDGKAGMELTQLSSATEGLPSPDHPLSDKEAKPQVLAEGIRVAQGETYKLQTAPRIKDLEQKAQAADQERQQLASMLVTALPGQRDTMVRKQKELEATSTANRALARVLGDESEYAIAERKAELLLNYTPQGRMDLTKLEEAREKDLKVVEAEQTRQRRRETMLQERQTEGEKKAEQEKTMNLAVQAAEAAIHKGGKVQTSIREAAEQYKVDGNLVGKRVLGSLSTGVPEAQMDLLAAVQGFRTRNRREPTEGEKGELARQVLKNRPGILPKEVMEVIKGERPLVEMQIGQEKAEAKEVGGGFGKQYIAIQEADLASRGQLAKLDRMEQLLTGVQTGALVPTLTQIQSIAQTFGIEVDKTLPAKQALQALSNEIALQLRNPSGGAGMPGALSDPDREFLVSMTPGLLKTPEGNRLIIDAGRKLAKRNQEVAQMARAYRKKNGQFDEGFFDELAAYSDTHPLFKAPDLSQYQEIRTTKDGRRLGKKADGTIEEIR